MIVATFNGIDLGLAVLLVVAVFVLYRLAQRVDEYEARLMSEWRDERIRHELDEPVGVVYDQEHDEWGSTLVDIWDLPEAGHGV